MATVGGREKKRVKIRNGKKKSKKEKNNKKKLQHIYCPSITALPSEGWTVNTARRKLLRSGATHKAISKIKRFFLGRVKCKQRANKAKTS